MDLEILVPPIKPFASEGRETGRINVQLFLEPVVPSNEGALSRLSSGTDRFIRKKLCESCSELGGRIRLPAGRQEESWIVLLTLKPSEEPLPVVQQEMPFALGCEVFF